MKLNRKWSAYMSVWPTAAAFSLALMPAFAAPLQGSISHDIHDYVQPGLQDLSLSLKTGQYNQKAGDKISTEFGQAYKLSGNGNVHYKQPSSLRLDGRIHGLSATLVTNGFDRRVSVGWFHKSQDESEAPGKVTTLLDVGLLNSFYLSYTAAQFQGVQGIEQTPCAVFRLSYPARLHDTSFRLLWIDPRTRIIRRREEHSQDGTLHAVYTYRLPVLVSGIWLPSEVDAANAAGEFVGQTFIRDARLNTGLTDTLFH